MPISSDVVPEKYHVSLQSFNYSLNLLKICLKCKDTALESFPQTSTAKYLIGLQLTGMPVAELKASVSFTDQLKVRNLPKGFKHMYKVELAPN